VWGEVEQPVELSWAEFEQLPRTRVTMDLHCVTAWSKFDTHWEGVSVRSLVDSGIIRLLPAARFVLQHAEYGFTANLPLEVVLQDNFLLATHFNGEPIRARPRLPAAGSHRRHPQSLRSKNPLSMEGRQVAARPRILERRQTRLLGTRRVPQRSRYLERTALRLARRINYEPGTIDSR
jgi:hypothetical protein